MYEEAEAKFRRMLIVSEHTGRHNDIATTLHNPATVYLENDESSEAYEKYRRALSIRQSLGERAGGAATFHQLVCWQSSVVALSQTLNV